MKPKRVVDEVLLGVVRSLPCIACAAPGPSHPHHIKSRGSGGHDTVPNLISLCCSHHTLIHARGLFYMARTYPSIRFWLEGAGWIRDEADDSWTPPPTPG